MPYAPQGIAVEPNSQSVVVTITETGGGTPVVYTDRSAQTTITMPATITTRTVFYLTDPNTFTVSAKVGGVENANGNAGTQLVDLTGGGVASLSVPVPVNSATTDNATYAALAGGNTLAGTQTVQNGYLVVADNRGPSNAPQINMDGNAGHWIQGIDVSNAPTSAHLVIVGKVGTYAFYDGGTTSGSATLTSTAQGQFTSAQVGKAISGPGIPAGTTVLSVQSATSLTLSANATATGSGVTVTITDASIYDQLFLNHGGGKPPTFGFGVTPPDLTAEVHIAVGPNGDPGRGGLRLLQVSGSTGNLMVMTDSGNIARLWVDTNFVVNGNSNTYGAALVVQGDATNNRTVSMIDNTKVTHWSWMYTGSTYLSLRSVTGAFSMLTVDSSKNLQLGAAGGGMGFYGGGAVAQPSAAGAAAGYAAGATAATFHSDDTYTGAVGTTAYTVNGIVAALKNLGLVKS